MATPKPGVTDAVLGIKENPSVIIMPWPGDINISLPANMADVMGASFVKASV